MVTRSEQMKLRWADPEWRARQCAALKGRTGMPVGKYKGASSCNFGRDPWNKGLTAATNESLAKQVEAARGKPSGMLGKSHSAETIEKIRIANTGKIGPRRGLTNSPEMRQRQSDSHIKWMIENPGPQKDTKPERILESKLNEQGLMHEKQKHIGRMLVDFYLPQQNLVIEVDGCYWHGCKDCCPNSPRTDRFEERCKRLNALGYEAIRIWEHELV